MALQEAEPCRALKVGLWSDCFTKVHPGADLFVMRFRFASVRFLSPGKAFSTRDTTYCATKCHRTLCCGIGGINVNRII